MTAGDTERGRPVPVLTAAALAVFVVAAVVQYAVPAAIPALERDGDALAGGQWWRAVTPLLVQTLGWYQVLTNLVTLALFGVLAEWLLGRRCWVVLFAAGAVGGQVAAYAWGEPGGGSSIAICGLAGGIAVTLVADRSAWSRPAGQATVYYVAALAGWGFAGIVAAAAAVAVTAVGLAVLMRVRPPQGERLAVAVSLGCAVVLLAAGDLHGAGLVSGAAAMIALIAVRRPRPLRTWLPG